MVTIAAQFNGPEHSGNGGYVCGLLAHEHTPVEGGSDPVTSMLRQPPPLDTPLTWERSGAEADTDELKLVTAGGAIIGTATDGTFARDTIPCPTIDEAKKGLDAYPGFELHPFDHCFTCGTQRAEGEGLRLFAGPIGEGRTAAPWSAREEFDGGDGALDVPTTWAVLDCPGGWSVDFSQHTIVLGRMTAQVLRRPRIDEPLLATGRLDVQDGRKYSTSTALYTREGELLGRAEQLWIEIDPAAFRL